MTKFCGLLSEIVLAKREEEESETLLTDVFGLLYIYSSFTYNDKTLVVVIWNRSGQKRKK